MNFRALLSIASLVLASTLAFAQSSPLIMYHADNLEVSRKRGTLLLYGNVHFVHDSVAFKTQRASWNRNTETVECNGCFLFTHPSGFVRAKNGSYQKRSEIAIASGEVSAGDSAGNYLMTGQYLKYDRKEDIVSIPMSPRLYQYDKQKNGKIDEEHRQKTIRAATVRSALLQHDAGLRCRESCLGRLRIR